MIKNILGDYTRIGNTHGPFKDGKKCYTITNNITIETLIIIDVQSQIAFMIQRKSFILVNTMKKINQLNLKKVRKVKKKEKE